MPLILGLNFAIGFAKSFINNKHQSSGNSRHQLVEIPCDQHVRITCALGFGFGIVVGYK
jgi:hypothetical protein